MPKERVRNSSTNDFADLMVSWGKDPGGSGDGDVEVFFAAEDLPGHDGAYYFHPQSPESFGLAEGESVGPVGVHMDRRQINRLIRVLRRARDDAYGTDA